MSKYRVLVTIAVTLFLIASGPAVLWAGVPTSDLAITKTDGAASSTPGTTVVYTITATNNGPNDATGVNAATVTDTFPGILSGCTWTCTASAGSSCTAGGAGNIADSADLLDAGTATYTVTCNIASSATGTLDNTATVSTTANDPNMANDSATDSNTLTPMSDLSISQSFNPPSPQTGEPFTMTVMVDNAGPSDATNVVVTSTIPPGLMPSTTGCVEDPNGVPTCTLGTIVAGGSASFQVALVAPGSEGSGTFTTSVAADDVDPVTVDNTDTTDIDFVSAGSVIDVPVSGDLGLALLALLLGTVALWRMRQS